MVVFQIIKHNWFGAILTGAVLGLFPSTGAAAQTADDNLSSIPQNRPSVESYSLPPGPDSAPQKNGLQGPVDPEIPLAKPVVVTPRESPAKAPSREPTPQSGSPASTPAAAGTTNRQIPKQVSPVPLKPEASEEESAAATDSSPLRPVAAADERQESTAAPTEAKSPPMDAAEAAETATADTDWFLLSFAALLLILLIALFLWRARRPSPKPTIAAKPDTVKTSLTGRAAKSPELLQPKPAIVIGFQPRSANATLINAVLSFELTLSNQGSEVLTNIRINGAMAQAKDDGSRDPDLTALSPLQDVPELQSSEPHTITAEFRIPLASINPIVFQSQALFVPMVQIALEYTDVAGNIHVQTAAFLVGREHQPPRPRMAPFRLDQGPRSFTPLGFRALAVG